MAFLPWTIASPVPGLASDGALAYDRYRMISLANRFHFAAACRTTAAC
jgi:hypothetical protein